MIVNSVMILANLLAVSISALQEPGPDAARPFVSLSESTVLQRVSFGSCHDQNIPKLSLPMFGVGRDIWTVIRESRPDVVVLLGDNVYAKTTDMQAMRAVYSKLAADEGFARLRMDVPILATWDDNDYGFSDVGAEYPKKSQSQAIFLEFFGVPKLSPRWGREGVYDAAIYGKPGARVQIIMLDTRYFRGPLVKRGSNEPRPPVDRSGPYVPTRDTSTTMLGASQWKWLEEQLRAPAELRIIGSSIQVISEEHGFEKWANFPHERERLFRLIRETGANGVIFLSGDRHHAEISRLDGAADYPLFDLTSSSLNKPRMFTIEANKHRVGDMFFQSNFGLISIDWDKENPTVRMEICDSAGKPVRAQEIALTDLEPK